MDIFVTGKNPSLIEDIRNSMKEADNLSVCSDNIGKRNWKEEDAVILISDDEKEIRRTAEALLPDVPLLVLSTRCLWMHFMDMPSVRFRTLPLTAMELRELLEDLRRTVSLKILLEKHVAGNSRDAAVLRNNIILASSSDVPTHIYGETGTGKTMAAELIHSLGTRKAREPVSINCATLSSSLIDSALFGHAEGAYTGAIKAREGLLARANHSTLFLDEIANLSEETQIKLLTTIDTGRYRAAGEDIERKTSFRLITASQVPLEELVEKKKLREDFYYRISSFSFTIKPLRQHPEDIPEIIRHFERCHKVKRSRIDDFTPFMKKNWKGNVRELQQVLRKIYMF